MTDLFCTNCGKEFEPNEAVVTVSTGSVEPIGLGWYVVEGESYIHTLCKACATGLEINGVVIEETLAQDSV